MKMCSVNIWITYFAYSLQKGYVGCMLKLVSFTLKLNFGKSWFIKALLIFMV